MKNILQRIKTLWVLSGLELEAPKSKQSFIKTLSSLVSSQQAVIVEKDDILDSIKL